MAALNGGQRIVINDTSLRYYYPGSGADAFAMKLNGSVSMGSEMSGSVNFSRIALNLEPLKQMLPGRISKSLASVPLRKPVTLNMSTDFRLAGSKTEAGLSMLARVPDFDISDLKLDARVRQDAGQQRVYLDNFRLASALWNVSLSAGGRVDLKKAPLSDSDLKLSLKINSPKKRKIYEDIELQGSVDISAAMKGDLETGSAGGSVKIDSFNVSSESKMFALSGMNMNFPFRYYFKTTGGGESLLTVRKNQLIDNDYFRAAPNFTIASIRAKHPARNMTIEYMKDFEAFMAFSGNVFQITNMRAYVLDGSLYGRRILFNIADLKPGNMEYMLELDATNIDINRLDKPNLKEKRRDAELSFNANFSGRGVNINRKLDSNGYINIHKIGNDFANSLMKGLSEKEGKSTLGIAQPVVDNTMMVKEFNFDLNKGLIYATVTLQRKAISYIFATRIKQNRVEFERIPIQEYLRKVGKGDTDETM